MASSDGDEENSSEDAVDDNDDSVTSPSSVAAATTCASPTAAGTDDDDDEEEEEEEDDEDDDGGGGRRSTGGRLVLALSGYRVSRRRMGRVGPSHRLPSVVTTPRRPRHRDRASRQTGAVTLLGAGSPGRERVRSRSPIVSRLSFRSCGALRGTLAPTTRHLVRGISPWLQEHQWYSPFIYATRSPFPSNEEDDEGEDDEDSDGHFNDVDDEDDEEDLFADDAMNDLTFDDDADDEAATMDLLGDMGDDDEDRVSPEDDAEEEEEDEEEEEEDEEETAEATTDWSSVPSTGETSRETVDLTTESTDLDSAGRESEAAQEARAEEGHGEPTSTSHSVHSAPQAEQAAAEEGAQRSFRSLAGSLLEILECPVCYEAMRPPIWQCSRGHLVCRDCAPRLSRCPTCRCGARRSRNCTMEKVCEQLQYPCRYRWRGCPVSLAPTELEAHESTSCEHRDAPCRVPRCSWRGVDGQVRAHVDATHPDLCRRARPGSPVTIRVPVWGYAHRVSRVLELRTKPHVFFVHFLMESSTSQLSGVVQLFGPPGEARAFQYKMELDERRHRERRQHRANRDALQRMAEIQHRISCYQARLWDSPESEPAQLAEPQTPCPGTCPASCRVCGVDEDPEHALRSPSAWRVSLDRARRFSRYSRNPKARIKLTLWSAEDRAVAEAR